LFFSFVSNVDDDIGTGVFSSIKLIASSAVTTDNCGFFVSIFIFAPFDTDEYYFHDCFWSDAAVLLVHLCSFSVSFPFVVLLKYFKRKVIGRKKIARCNAITEEKKHKSTAFCGCWYQAHLIEQQKKQQQQCLL
jgi:hypothetical protein